jgi:poly(A) polymerase Pap1
LIDYINIDRLYCVGSYALGVHSNDGDIDCICVGTMERQEFFSKAKNSLACTPDVKVKKV